jgi:isoquinoline 1-oxidoreductase subunit beta
MIIFKVNGQEHRLASDAKTPLLWALRDELRLKGTKYGCGIGVCGICTVLLDGDPVRACVMPLADVAGRKVTTIEGLAADPEHALLRAWRAEQVPQCGYCQPGAIMAAAALLARTSSPSDAEVAATVGGVLCRCGTYRRMRKAIDRAVRPADRLVPGDCHRFAESPGAAMFQPNPWVRIAADGTVTIIIDRAEMGQGVNTALAMLVAEELEVDLAQIRTEFAPADPAYANPEFGEQVTGGSTSVRSAWLPLRRAGAQAREMLIAAAAAIWQVDPSECRAEHGAVLHLRTERRLTFGELAAGAATQAVPEAPELKEPTAFRLIGKPVTRIELKSHLAGKTVFGSDIDLPNMLVAMVLRCPVIGGTVANFDDRGAKRVDGVVAVFKMGAGVAVVAKDTWAALSGRAALKVRWKGGPNADLNSDKIRRRLATAARRKGRVVRDEGNVDAAFRRAKIVIEASYETPFQAHACLEPMNCTAFVRGGQCDVWAPTQAQTSAQEIAAWACGLPRESVYVHTTFIGGGFGRRLDQDFVEEAVRIAKHVGKPVHVFWTRDDDMHHDHYRPAHRVALRAALLGNDKPIAWFQRVAGPSLALDGVDLPYAIPNIREEQVTVDLAVPTGPWRSVGSSQNAFVIECFIDELAHAAGTDSFIFRRDLLSGAPRHRQVLELAVENAGWGKPLSDGHYQGLAVYHSFGSWVAQVAEVSVSGSGNVQVHRVVCAIDCGLVINPDTVAAQMEGAIAFGLSAALKSEITLESGCIAQSNFRDYPLITMAEMPQVDVYIVPSDNAPGGVGEPGVPPIAPAVANAVFAATGKRMRHLPIRPADLLRGRRNET